MGIKKIIAAGAVLTLLAGCTVNRAEYQGEWIGKKGLQYETDDATIAGTLDRVRLQIKPNDDFMLIDGGVPLQGRTNWTGSGATLEVIKVLGKETNVDPITITLRGKQLMLQLEGNEVLLDRLK